MEWFEIPNILVVCGIAWTLASITDVVMKWKKGVWRLGFKEAWRHLVMMGGLVWVLYFITTSIALLIPFTNWFREYSVSRYWSSSTLWILDSIPYFYVATVLLFSVWFLSRVLTYKLRYTEEEEMVYKEEKFGLKKRLGWFGRFIEEGK